MIEVNKIYNENCIEGLKKIDDNSIDCCVTSPPYYGLRDYGNKEQIGLEKTPELYVEQLVNVFSEVKRVLKPNGTLWLNLGDSYCGSGKGAANDPENAMKYKQGSNKGTLSKATSINTIGNGLKAKDLIGIPWMVAFALRSNGWYLRQDIIWSKPNPMPESVTDRPTKQHEYIFLMSKSPKYYYDADAISEPAKYGINGIDNRPAGIVRDREYDYDSKSKDIPRPFFKNAKNYNGKHSDKQRGYSRRHAGFNERWDLMTNKEQCSGKRNKRSVWSVAIFPYKEAHFATFPEKLIVDCIKAGCPENGIAIDPFMGAGTTALVAKKLNRNFIGFELNQKYITIAEKRLEKELGLFN